MVPSDYRDFFTAAASVAGALIGLLFVAISVVPEKVTGDKASLAHQTRAVLAFSALVDALVLSLWGVLPGGNLGPAGLVFGIIGASSTIGAGVRMAQRATRDERRAQRSAYRQRSIRQRFFSVANPVFVVRRVLLLFGVYVAQVVTAIDFTSSPRSVGDVQTFATLIIVAFLFSIDRAWELLGGGHSGILWVLFSVGEEPEEATGAATGADEDAAP